MLIIVPNCPRCKKPMKHHFAETKLENGDVIWINYWLCEDCLEITQAFVQGVRFAKKKNKHKKEMIKNERL